MAEHEHKHEEKEETKKQIIEDIEKSGVPEKIAEKEEKIDEQIEKKLEKTETKEEKKDSKKETRAPKSEAVVNSINAHLSAKTSAYVCKFIKNKTIDQAIEDLEMVIAQKKVVPMKGEIPHRKGKGIMSGRYPKNAAEHFIKLLKTLAGNSNVNGLEDPVIVEAFANIGERPFGKFGAVRRKRAHIKIIAKNKVKNKKHKEKKK
jgi:ribosomal protein L22